MKTLPILIVEDDTDLREALSDTLTLAGHQVLTAEEGTAALTVLSRHKVGLVISDVQMQPMDGHQLLKEIKTSYPNVPVLLMTAYGMIEKAVDAMRCGACNYLVKPFEAEKLLAEVARHMQPVPSGDDTDVVAEDPRTVALLELAKRVAFTSATVLITGESGTGKEVLARFLHRNSPRHDHAFVAINCAAIPENLLESTLFGYEKGAFTGASQSQAGKFEQAEGGTLLLDEISEMPLALQAKLLRVLQEREVERVGGRRPIPIDVRLIATSNRHMEAEVAKGSFREDLYYRLNVFPLEIPPLRERTKDIIPLARRCIGHFASSIGRHGLALSKDAEYQLTHYEWPGNIRELENIIQRAMILAPGDVIEVDHLCLPKAQKSAKAQPNGGLSSEASAVPMDMKSLERTHIMETLNAVNGSRKLAAQRLGMSERTLRHKLQQYRMEEGGGDAFAEN
jgi:two-component system response regulator FlrC